MVAISKPKLQTDLYLCPACDGDGKHYIDEPDAVEGYKLARTIACPLCDGKQRFAKDSPIGQAVKAFWETLNDIRKHEYLKKVSDFEHSKEVARVALSKLSFDEIKALRDLDIISIDDPGEVFKKTFDTI